MTAPATVNRRLAHRLGPLAGALTIVLALAGHARAHVPVISTVAGTGSGGFSGDGGPAVLARLDGPRAVTWSTRGGFVVADLINERVRAVSPAGAISTLAGDGLRGDEGDGGAAASAELDFPHAVAALPDGHIAIADERNDRIRHVDSATGIVTTIVGTGNKGFSGDGGPALAARISDVRGLAALPDGGLLVADSDNQVVRRVEPGGSSGHSGRIVTVAGTAGGAGFSGDGGPALAAHLRAPYAVTPTRDGGFLVADEGNGRVRAVTPAGGITTVAGSGIPATTDGDGGPATSTSLVEPHAVVEVPPGSPLGGGFLVAENGGNRVRYVSPDGRISTLAGTGVAGTTGDGGPPASAELNGPRGLSIRADGSLLIAEFGPANFTAPPIPAGGDRVRLVRWSPTIALRLVRSLRARRGRRPVLEVRATGGGRASVVLTRRRHRPTRAQAPIAVGDNRILLPRSVSAGRYGLTLVVRDRDGAAGRLRTRVTVRSY